MCPRRVEAEEGAVAEVEVGEPEPVLELAKEERQPSPVRGLAKVLAKAGGLGRTQSTVRGLPTCLASDGVTFGP
jgi:hypothetical protein